MEGLKIEAPITLYQAAEGVMNAALWYIPDEIHIVFYGPVLDRLSGPELLALIGHELAHYRLWSIEDGAFHTARRILDHALAYREATPSHHETARLYQLHTELYADRGGALAAGGIRPAIATLVKTMTGLSTVDPDAYLQQASELEAQGNDSSGISHPESFIRAQALDKWWRQTEGLDQWIDHRLRAGVSLAALDLQGQRVMVEVTRGFLARFLQTSGLHSEMILSQVTRYFPDWQSSELPIEDAALSSDRIHDTVRDYLIAVMFDIAMADRDMKEGLLLAGARLARELGWLEAFRVGLKRDLAMTRPAIDRLIKQSDEAA